MAINLERRKAVMSRSVKLGHCVCNPRQGCPCETFKNFNVCPCAGEKMPPPSGPVALTRYVHKAGCASKIGQADLKRILGQLPPVTDPNVLLGAAAGDDAGVYRLNDRYHLVQTVDVFTPCVDDAYLFGQIAAANSLSDIYAMGGRPLTALSVIGFPIDDLDGSVMAAMLQGGMQKLQEAGCALLGGHSLQDEEVKCGFAITGLIDAGQTIVRDNAQPGDVLVITKPIGTGMISFAAQIGRLGAEVLHEAGQVMAVLNKDAAELMARHHANACTDVTGFGLLGHLVEMARNSHVSIELDMGALPVFAAAAECVANDIFPGAIERNQEYSMAWVRVAAVDDASSEKNAALLYDPQTSGGLLISLPEAPARELVHELHARGHTATAIIGRVQPNHSAKEGEVVVVNTRLKNLVGRRNCLQPAPKKTPKTANPTLPLMNTDTTDTACCAGVSNSSPGVAPASLPPTDESPEASELYARFIEQANQPGLIDRRNKKLMAIALSVAQRCQPCMVMHLKTALSQGLSKAEIDEAAWLGIAFAGSPALVMYKEAWRQCRENQSNQS